MRAGDYAEHGITRLHGFAAELAVVPAEHLVTVPELGRIGVLAEPASICARAIRHAHAVGGRQPWRPRRALVLGAGAIGMLSTTFSSSRTRRLDGRARAGRQREGTARRGLRRALRPTTATPPAALATDVGGFDIVIVAAGSAQLSLDSLGMLRRGGVACLLIDGRDQYVQLHGPVIGVDAVLGNRALIGSVNANVVDWHAAVDRLGAAQRRWPDALDRFVGLRVLLDDYADAFAFAGVKATLALAVSAVTAWRQTLPPAVLGHQFCNDARRIAAEVVRAGLARRDHRAAAAA